MLFEIVFNNELKKLNNIFIDNTNNMKYNMENITHNINNKISTITNNINDGITTIKNMVKNKKKNIDNEITTNDIKENYKIININDNLTSNTINIKFSNYNPYDYLFALNHNQQYRYNENNILYHLETKSLLDKYKIFNNNFINSVLYPYNNHQSIILIPDNFWLMILYYFGDYVNKNSSRLRKSFVLHEDKINLAVDNCDSTCQTINWEEFLISIKNEINKNTHPGVVQLFECNFTTSTPIHKIISISVIMDTLKQYFTYTCELSRCGIRKVKFMGTVDDWSLLITKTLSLYSYISDDSNDKLKIYLDNIMIILNNFLETYNENVNLNFWEKIINSEEEIRSGSGKTHIDYIDGWLLHFYGIYEKTDIEEIPSFSVSVPINIVDQYTKSNITQVELINKWGSVSILCDNNEYYCKPNLNLYIIEKSNQTSFIF